MPRFRKKPIVIEAEQWFPEKEVEGVTTFDVQNKDGSMTKGGIIFSPWGDVEISPGDWVITGVNGEKYPCKPDIFEKTYEAIDD